MGTFKKSFLMFSFYFLIVPIVFGKAEWTFLVYAQTKNDLNSYFIQNLRDMAQVGSNKRLNVIVQWEQPKRDGIWRYKVNKGKVALQQHLDTPTGDDCVADLVDFTRWAVSKYPAKHYALILSSHGSGIVDPAYWRSCTLRNFESGLDLKSPRGILFNWEKRNYMTNQNLSDALKGIKNDVLGRNLDVLGMDACLMSTLEMHYQVKDYIDFFVASQEQEPAGGWFFSDFFKDLASKNLTPSELSSLIVNSYETYYQHRFDWYTQSAVSLENISLIKDNLDEIIINLNKCSKKFGKGIIKNIVRQARRSCLQFNVPFYVDLHSFYDELNKALEKGDSIKAPMLDDDEQEELTFLENSFDVFMNSPQGEDFGDLKGSTDELDSYLDVEFCENIDLPASMDEELSIRSSSEGVKSFNKVDSDVVELKSQLALGMKLIESEVVANVAGSSTSRAKGLSIYYPNDRVVDLSYPRTFFAQESLWLEFLRDYVK